jgi:hypothetical protein
MAKKQNAPKADIDLTQEVSEAQIEAAVNADPVPSIERVIGFTEAQRVLKAHDCNVDISSINEDGLRYLLVLGFTTSLTQCNAGVATAARELGKSDVEVQAELAANRQERLQKICAGTIGSRVAGPKISADDKLLRDFAWAAITREYAKAAKPLPKDKGAKNSEIDALLAGPRGDVIRRQVEAFTVDLDA